jgi:cell division protein FtsL
MSAELAPRLVANARAAKQATYRRVSRKRRAHYSGLLNFCSILTLGLFVVMLYVMGTAHLTSLNYAVARAQRERAALQSEDARLDDQLAALESDDRLARVAARLHMVDPQQFALVALPQPVHREEGTSHLALLSGLAGLLRAK